MVFLPSLGPETWALLAVCCILLLLYGIWPYDVFKKLGIPGPRPLPFIGTFLEYRKGLLEFDLEYSKKYGKIWGFYEGRQPVMAILDPVLIKIILVKECYTVFTNRRMLPLIKHHGDILVRNIGRKVSRDKVVDMKEIFGAYSLDTITSAFFGVDTDSINNPDDILLQRIKKLISFSFLSPLIFIVVMFPFLVPWMQRMNVTILPRAELEFFVNVTQRLKQQRQDSGNRDRVDFLQLMIDSQGTGSLESSNINMSPKALTDSEISAQGVTFLFAGYETSSLTLSFVAYNLALHPEVQVKLREEIDSTFPNKADLTYEGLFQMEYLDMVVNETLRLFPLGGRLERVCKKTVEIHGVTIPKGTVVMVPTYVLHHDPKYWSEPEEFRPERFSKENKKDVDPYVFLPFGAGPRLCIGMRFALLSIKAATALLLQNFSVETCKETPIPLELDTLRFMQPKKPILLKLTPRMRTAS
ncbi:cytochrome P450 3A21-like [Rhynchocyon petersi]